MRTGRARRGAIPIEEIRHEVDEAERWVETLLARWPEIQRNGNGERVTNDGEEHVTRHDTRQVQQAIAGLEVSHTLNRISDIVLGGTGVGSSQVTGAPSQNIPLSNTQGKSVSVDSDLVVPLSDSDLDTSAQNKSRLFGSGMYLGPLGQFSELGPQYFVTEPPDTPKASHSNQNHFTLCTNPKDFQPSPNPSTLPNSPPFQPSLNLSSHPHSPPHPQIVELNSPTPLTTPKPLDLTLSTTFKSLAIKRKAQDELPENQSKILRICSSNPHPKPTQISPRRSSRITPKRNRYSKSQRKRKSYIADSAMVEDNLVEIQIQDFNEVSGVMDEMLPEINAQNEDSAQLNGEGLMAGLK